MTPQTVEFFFEFSSPYSYLASTQIPGIAARHKAEVYWKPIVLGAVLNHVGSQMPAAIPAKGAYMLHDLRRWAEQYKVPITMPAMFPVRSITAHRAILAVKRDYDQAAMVRLIHACFRAYWVDGRDISNIEVLGDLIKSTGLDADRVLKNTQDPDIKGALRAFTDEALSRGVFGAPTMFVGDEMYWGNDRLQFVDGALARLSANEIKPLST